MSLKKLKESNETNYQRTTTIIFHFSRINRHRHHYQKTQIKNGYSINQSKNSLNEK